MDGWLIVAACLAALLVPLGAVAALAPPASGIVAAQMAGADTTLALLALAQGLGREPFATLAVVLAVLSPIGTIAFAALLEQEAGAG
jgi:multisubunit Na+/H+ antiporter MnhF subunit